METAETWGKMKLVDRRGKNKRSKVERQEENGYCERQKKSLEMFPPPPSMLAPVLCQAISLEKEPVRVHCCSSPSECVIKMESSM